MTDKERLEMIKGIQKRIKECQEKGQNVSNLHSDYVDWLIKQTEKREYWIKQHRKRCNELEDAYFKIQLIEKQLRQAQAKAERYKQALEFYAERDNYQWEVSYRPQQEIDCMVIDDSGHTARKALKGE